MFVSVNPRRGEPPTGEPCAGDPLARFGGRGDRATGLSYPYQTSAVKKAPFGAAEAASLTAARSCLIRMAMNV